MNGVTTCLCVGALIWAGLAIIGSLTGRNRRAHLLGGTSADPWASAGLAWLFWSHHHNHTDDTTNAAMTGDQSEQYLDGDVVTPDADGDQGGGWDSGSADGGGWDSGSSDSGGWSSD